MGFSFIVDAEEAGSRLEVVLRKRFPEAARKPMRALLGTGVVRVTGSPAAKGTRLNQGEKVTCEQDLARRDFLPHPDPDLPVKVVHEDEHLLVVDKPAGMPSHPLIEDQRGAVANWLSAHYPETILAGSSPREAGLIQRLDIGTSGLLMVARTPKAHQAFWNLGKEGGIEKTYIILAMGKWRGPDHIKWPIAAHPTDRSRVLAVKGEGERYRGRLLPAETRVTLIRQLGRFFLAKISLLTGRRHQVRIHLAAAGNPLVGDQHYRGLDPFGLEGPFLHAGGLEMVHPFTKEPIYLDSALPDKLMKVLQTATALREQVPDEPPPRRGSGNDRRHDGPRGNGRNQGGTSHRGGGSQRSPRDGNRVDGNRADGNRSRPVGGGGQGRPNDRSPNSSGNSKGGGRRSSSGDGRSGGPAQGRKGGGKTGEGGSRRA